MKTIFCAVRIPHQSPATIHFNYPERELDEYDSFWDDCHSVKTFDNIEQIKTFLESKYRGHQWPKVTALLSDFIEQNQ